MESLIELVAASFARHGIECRDASEGTDAFVPLCLGVASAEHRVATRAAPETELRVAEPVLTSELPDHNYLNTLLDDPAP
jgi:hypothetical protein